MTSADPVLDTVRRKLSIAPGPGATLHQRLRIPVAPPTAEAVRPEVPSLVRDLIPVVRSGAVAERIEAAGVLRELARLSAADAGEAVPALRAALRDPAGMRTESDPDGSETFADRHYVREAAARALLAIDPAGCAAELIPVMIELMGRPSGQMVPRPWTYVRFRDDEWRALGPAAVAALRAALTHPPVEAEPPADEAERLLWQFAPAARPAPPHESIRLGAAEALRALGV